MREMLPDIHQLNAQVVGISADSEWSHKAFAEQLGIDFPLLSDWFGNVGRLYDAWSEEKQREKRVVYVVDSAGVISYEHVYADEEAPDFEPVIDVLRRLQEQEEKLAG
ncbi:MAG: redoxin domain-containing protein [Firmicutes bacterium]|nr:redoxin domain-containing protein [Bacillota bacterium]